MWKVGSCCDSIRGCLGVVGFVGLDFEGFVYYSMLRLSPEVSGSRRWGSLVFVRFIFNRFNMVRWLEIWCLSLRSTPHKAWGHLAIDLRMVQVLGDID